MDGPLRSPILCLQPWLELLVHPNGEVRPCCRCSSGVGAPDNPPHHIGQTSLAELWNSALYRDFRRRLYEGKGPLPPWCESCATEEATGQASTRFFSLDRLRPENGEEARQLAAMLLESSRNGFAAPPPRSLIIRSGTLCNASCRFCVPHSSTCLRANMIQTRWAETEECQRFHHDPESHPPSMPRMSAALAAEEFAKMARMATTVSVSGGEPGLIPATEVFLAALAERHLPEGLTFATNTNVSVFHHEMVRQLRRLPRSRVYLSIDAVGSLYEYLRPPLRWRTAASVAERWAAEADEQLEVVCNAVLSVYNSLDIVDVYRWVSSRGIVLSTNLLGFKRLMHPRLLPRSARRLAAERLRGFLAECEKGRMRHDYTFPHRVAHMAAMLENPDSQTSSEEERRAFMQFTNDLDAVHGQRFALVCPELFGLWEEEYGPWDYTPHFVTLPEATVRSLPRVVELLGREATENAKNARRLRGDIVKANTELREHENRIRSARLAAEQINASRWSAVGRKLGLN